MLRSFNLPQACDSGTIVARRCLVAKFGAPQGPYDQIARPRHPENTTLLSVPWCQSASLLTSTQCSSMGRSHSIVCVAFDRHLDDQLFVLKRSLPVWEAIYQPRHEIAPLAPLPLVLQHLEQPPHPLGERQEGGNGTAGASTSGGIKSTSGKRGGSSYPMSSSYDSGTGTSAAGKGCTRAMSL